MIQFSLVLVKRENASNRVVDGVENLCSLGKLSQSLSSDLVMFSSFTLYFSFVGYES